MQSNAIPTHYARIKRVHSFQELAATPFADGVNALCWERTLPGDFSEVAARIGVGEGITALDEARLQGLALSARGREAVAVMLADLRLLRELGRDPVLNRIDGYPRDEQPGPVATDVFSYHADSAPVETDTWLCTYHGPASEGLRNEDALRKVDIPATRAELLRLFGGEDNDGFREFLRENCYDLHYAPVAGAQPFSFGVGNLWRIACEYTGLVRQNSPERRRVPPCIHRAPEKRPGDPPRLLLIS